MIFQCTIQSRYTFAWIQIKQHAYLIMNIYIYIFIFIFIFLLPCHPRAMLKCVFFFDVSNEAMYLPRHLNVMATELDTKFFC